MKQRKLIPLILLTALSCSMISCGGKKESGENLAEAASGDISSYESTDVNEIEQARPTIMIIPGDRTLEAFNCLKQQSVDGVNYTIRDYKTYVLKDDRCRRINSFIQNAFDKFNYPLTDFEQTLKQLDSRSAIDLADNIRKDAKTQLLMTAHPDIILEMDYISSADKMLQQKARIWGHKSGKKTAEIKNVSYTLSAIDAYTNKTVATITKSNIKGNSTTEAIQTDLAQQLPGLMNGVKKYFSDILKRGREVTIKINMADDSNQSLSDESIEGDTYTDAIIDYVKRHTVKGACKLETNTSSELTFTNCRIKLLDENGVQYGVYDFTRDLQRYLRKTLGLKSTNNSQGLGEVVLTLKGI